MKRCPAAVLMEPKISMILGYFSHYRQTFQFPDGRSIIEQPKALVSAFNFMGNLCSIREELKK